MRLVSLSVLFGMPLLGLAWLVPNHELPWVSFYGEACAAVACMLLYAGTQGLRVTGISLLPLVALMAGAVPLVQLAFGKILFSGDAWVASLYPTAFAIACMTGRMLGDKYGPARCIEGLAYVFLSASMVSTAIAAYQWLSLTGLGIYAVDLPPGGRPFGNLAQPNQFATTLMLSAAFAIALREMERIGDRTLVLVMLWLGFGVAMSQSRTGLVEAALLSCVVVLTKRKASLQTNRVAVAIGFVATALLYSSWEIICRALYLEPARSLKEQATGGARTIHWTSLLDAIGQRPWTGYGWNQVSVAQSLVASSHPAPRETIEHSHNIVLDMLLWNGIPIGLTLICVLVWWYWRHLRGPVTPLSAVLVAGTGVVMVHALLEYPLEYLYFLVPVGLTMGIVESIQGTRILVSAPRLATGGLGVVVALLMGWVAHDFVFLVSNTQTMRLEMARIGTGKVQSSAPEVVLLTQQREFLRYARTLARPGMTSVELDWMDNVSRRFPYPPAVFRYALAAALNGRPLEASDALNRLCKLNVKARCDEGRVAWERLAQESFPQIRSVAFPVDDG